MSWCRRKICSWKIICGRKSLVKKTKNWNRLKEERKSTNLSRKEKNFLCESDWYKEVAAKPKFAIHNVKTRFPFIYASTSLDTKRLTLASNCNFESCMSIRCFAPQHILQFFHFCRGVFFAFGNFAHHCVVLLNAPLSDRDIKNVSAMGFFSRKILIRSRWRQEVPCPIGLRFQKAR